MLRRVFPPTITRATARRARRLLALGYGPRSIARSLRLPVAKVEHLVASIEAAQASRTPPVWTVTRWTAAQEMRALGCDDDEIARDLGLTKKQVTAKFANEGYRLHAAERRERDAPVLLERERMNDARARQSLTASIMGDPPPGFSALDRKQGRAPQ